MYPKYLKYLEKELITLYEFDGNEFKPVDIFIKAKIEIDEDLKYVESFLGEKWQKEYSNKFDKHKLELADIAKILNYSYMKGYEEKLSFSERKELVSVLSGDLAVGGFLASGIFSIIESFRFFFDYIIFAIGISSIIIGIILYIILRKIKRKSELKQKEILRNITKRLEVEKKRK